MIKQIIFSLPLLFSATAYGHTATPNANFGYQQPGSNPFSLAANKHNIEINNRILAKVRGEIISVIDIKKKLDVVFAREYPQHSDNLEARYQFYSTQWRNVLRDMIDKELILADAEEMEMDVSHGDIRQEMEELFGPDILANLDKIDLSYDEAWAMLETDILIRRMMLGRVNMKAIAKITPCIVREAYDELVKNYKDNKRYRYRTITIRDTDEERALITSKDIHQMLTINKSTLETLEANLAAEEKLPEGSSIKISESFHHDTSKLSEAYQRILENLSIGDYSSPIAQKSRANNSLVYRIFLLEDMQNPSPPAFVDVEDALRNKLVDVAIGEETLKYLKHLHNHFDMTDEVLAENLPDDFKPFIIL